MKKKTATTTKQISIAVRGLARAAVPDIARHVQCLYVLPLVPGRRPFSPILFVDTGGLQTCVMPIRQ